MTDALSGDGIVVSKKLVVVNSASFVAARLLNVTVLIWVYQYLIGRIPIAEFAVYPVVAAVMIVAPLFFSSITGGIVRYVVEAVARNDREAVTRIVSSIYPTLAALTFIFLCVGLAFAAHIDGILRIPNNMVDEAKLMMALLVGGFAFQMLMLPLCGGFHVRQRFVELNILALLREVLRVFILLTLLFGLGPSVLWVVVAAVASEVAYTIAQVVRSRQLVPELRFVPSLFERRRAVELISFGVWTTVGQLGILMYTHAGTVVLNLFSTPSAVTVYFIASTLFKQLETLILVAVQPLQTVLTTFHAQADTARLANTMHRAGRYALWVSLIVAVPGFLYSQSFISLYLGDQYATGAIVIALMMIIFPFNQATILLPMVSIATARVREFFLPAFLFQAAGLIIILILVVHYELGAAGAAAGIASMTILSQLSYYWWLGLRISRWSAREFSTTVLLRGWGPALVAGPVWFGLGEVFGTTDWFSLMAVGAGGAIVYIATLLILAIDDLERAWIRSGVAKLIHHIGRSKAVAV